MDPKAIYVFDQIQKATKAKAVKKDKELMTLLQQYLDALDDGADYRQVASQLSIKIAQYRTIHHFQPPHAIEVLYKQLVAIGGRYKHMPTTINQWLNS